MTPIENQSCWLSSLATISSDSRLEEIRATPAGWYDNENHASSPAAIEVMRRFLVNVAMQPAPLPHIYPLRSGGIAVEWTMGAWEASAEVDETGSQMTLTAVNIETLNEIDLMIDVHSTEIMPQFMTFINAMSKDEKIPNAKK